MSKIRKFINGEWKTFAETNSNQNAARISTIVGGEQSTVESVLNAQNADIEKLKQNVAWLALHGGGGAGGGGGGSSSATASCTLMVNNKPSNNEIPIVEGQDLVISISDVYPKNPKASWEVVVQIGKFRQEFSLNNKRTYQSFSYNQYKSEVPADQKKIVTVTATYRDTVNGINGDESWTGQIYMAQVKLNIVHAESVKLDDTGKLIDSNVDVTVITPLEDDIIVSSTIVGESDRYDIPLLSETYERRFSVPFSRLFGDIEIQSTVYTLEITAQSKTQSSVRTSFTASIPVKSDNITLGVFGVSTIKPITKRGTTSSPIDSQPTLVPSDVYHSGQPTLGDVVVYADNTYKWSQITDDDGNTVKQWVQFEDKSAPTQVTSDSKNIRMSWIAYLTDAQNYTIKVYSKLGGSEQILFDSTATNRSYTYNILQDDKLISLPDNFVETSGYYTLYVKATDSLNKDKTSEKECYVQVVASADTRLEYAPSTLSSQIIGIYAPNLSRFNTITGALPVELDTSYEAPDWTKPSVMLSSFYINNNSGVKTKSNTSETWLAFRNGMYSYTDANGIGIEKGVFGSGQWTVGITYKSDFYTTNDNFLFGIGYWNQSAKQFQDGIVIKPHGIYRVTPENNGIAEEKLRDLVDDTYNTVHFVYDNTSNSPTVWKQDRVSQTDDGVTRNYYKSSFKIFVDGVLTYAQETCPFETLDDGSIKHAGNIGMLIGGENPTNHGNIAIYSLEAFAKCFNMNDILVSLCNARIATHTTDVGGLDYSQKRTELKRCIFSENSDHTISSEIYSITAGFNFNNLVIDVKDQPLHPPTSQAELNEYTKIKALAKSIPFPLVFLQLNQANGGDHQWTKNNFLKRVSDANLHPLNPDNEQQQCTSTLYYWDPNAGEDSYALSCDKVMVKLQGTSTLGSYVKNIDITLPRSGNTETLLFVNDRWIPENTYTLKSDIVDSSHSNNAAIGRVINDLLSIDNSYQFKFNSAANDCVKATRNVLNSDTITDKSAVNFDNVSIKHTVEGFPVMLFLKFYEDSTTSDGEQAAKTPYVPMGIYSFNLGRKAVRNLGFETITDITLPTNESQQTEKITRIPCIIRDAKVERTLLPNSLWIERDESSTMELHNNSQFNDSSSQMNDFDVSDGDKLAKASFWQDDANIIDQFFKIKHSSYDSTADIKPSTSVFGDMVREIVRLPIEGRCKHDVQRICVQTDVGGTYAKYSYNNGYERNGTVDMVNRINNASEVEHIERDMITKYMCVALLFGLVDNFDKNIAYRSFNRSNIIPEFYDLDTSLGLWNSGRQEVSPLTWFNFIHNKRTPNGIDVIDESYDTNNIPAQYLEDYKYHTPESVCNKLFLAIDSNAFRNLDEKRKCSLISYNWFMLRSFLHSHAVNAGYRDFVDMFMNRYYRAQTDTCGTIMFNYDYMIKYANDFTGSNTIGDSSGASEWSMHLNEENTIGELNGRRFEYVERWLREHLDFLDSYFEWRLGTYSDVLIESSLNQYKKFASVNKQLIVITGADDNMLQYTTAKGNSCTLMNFTTAGQTATRYYALLPKNDEVNIGLPAKTGLKYNLRGINSVLSVDFNLMYPAQFQLESGTESLYNLTTFSLTGRRIEQAIDLGMFYDDEHESQLSSINLNRLSSMKPINLDFGSKSDKFQHLQSINIADSQAVQSLTLGSAPLQSLILSGSNVQNIQIVTQPYLNIPNLSGCQQLQNIHIQNCVMDSSLPQFAYTDLNLSGFNQLTSVYVDACNTISSVTIKDCKKLSQVQILNCSALKRISVVSCDSIVDVMQIADNNQLSAINLSYCQNLTEFKLKHDERATALKSINVAYTKVKGIRWYNYTKSEYEHTMHTIDGVNCYVLDFKGLDALTTATYYHDPSIQAIRFNNYRHAPFNVTCEFGGSESNQLSNLKRIYGHIKTNGKGFVSCSSLSLIGKDSYSSGWWYGHGASTRVSVFQKHGLHNKDFKTIAKGCDGNNSTSGSHFYNGEFDDDAWAFNMTVTGSMPLCYGASSMTQRDIFYVLYRTAIANNLDGQNITSMESRFCGAGADTSMLNFNAYTFKGLDKITNINAAFVGKKSPYLFSSTVLSCMPNITSYASWASYVKFDKTSSNYMTKVTSFSRRTDVTETITFDESGSFEENSSTFFSKMTQLTSISNIDIGGKFNPTLMRLPKSIKTISGSFNSLPAALDSSQCMFDFDLVFAYNGENSDISSITSSFNHARYQYILRPRSFEHMPNLKRIGNNYNTNVTAACYEATAKRHIVTDDIIRDQQNDSGEIISRSVRAQDEYKEALKSRTGRDNYVQADYDEFQDKFLSFTPGLSTYTYMLAGAALSSYNSLGQLVPTFPGKLYEKTPNMQFIDAAMKNTRFLYKLTSNGFANCSNLSSARELFYQAPISSWTAGDSTVSVPSNSYDCIGIVNMNQGISGEIPTRLFYHGDLPDTTSTLSGLVDDNDTLPNIPQTISEFRDSIRMALTTPAFGVFIGRLSSAYICEPAILAKLSVQVNIPSGEFFDFSNADLRSQLSDEFESVLSADEDGNNSGVRQDTDNHPYSKIYATLSALSGIATTTALNQAFGLSSVTVTRKNFKTSLHDLYRCFYGNGNITPYTCDKSKIESEPNSSYNPFRYVFTSSLSWMNNTDSRDKFTHDDSWTQDGRVLVDYTLTGDARVSPENLLFNPDHKNTVDIGMESMQFGSSNYLDLVTSTGNASSRRYFVAFKYNDPHGRISSHADVMNYICAPDLLRYLSNTNTAAASQIPNVTGLFAHTSNSVWALDTALGHNATHAGMVGRIPPNLFRHLTNLEDLTEVFSHCRMISGYKRTTASADGSSKSVNVYYLPEGLFKGMHVTQLHKMCYDNVMPATILIKNAKLNLAAPFIDLKNNTYQVDVSAIFGKSVWLQVFTSDDSSVASQDTPIMGVFYIPKIRCAEGAFSRGGYSGTYSSGKWLMNRYVSSVEQLDISDGGTWEGGYYNQCFITLDQITGSVFDGGKTKRNGTIIQQFDPDTGSYEPNSKRVNVYTAAYFNQNFRDDANNTYAVYARQLHNSSYELAKTVKSPYNA